MTREPTLSEVLAFLGYTHEPAPKDGPDRRNVLRGNEVVFTGRAREVWDWLKETGQHATSNHVAR